MTWFDLAAFGLIALCTLTSMFRGLIGEIFSLSGWILSALLARSFAPELADAAFSSMQPRVMAVTLSFILITFAARFVQHFLQSMLNSLIDKCHLGSVNRLFGAILGAVKGTVFVTLAVLLAALTDLPRHPDWQNAASAPVFENLAGLAVPYLPEFLSEKIHYPTDTNPTE